MNDYQKFIFLSKYARFNEALGRRETWEECVLRYTDYWLCKGLITKQEAVRLYEAIYNLEVMPSMRLLTTAGKAVDEHNVAAYNCSYLELDRPTRFSELLYICMCGSGVGYSVESRVINKLPDVPDELYKTDTTIVVADSKIGWAKAFKELISLLYSGQIPAWDVSRVRAKGDRLVTFGGRASGPGPLVSLFDFTVDTFSKARGRKLNSLECHDICCKVADIVVVGGVRRSALISFSDPTDTSMRRAKSGNWWEANAYRSNANNSLVYSDNPSVPDFLNEWKELYESRSGERGIFSRRAAKYHLEQNVERRSSEHNFGTNPCSEIILRPQQFCNLTEVVVRPGDSLEELKRKIEIATILGTLQSTLTDFKFLSREWKQNCEEERLLGVSLTGIMDHGVLSDKYGSEGKDIIDWLRELKEHAITTNKEWANRLGINPSAAITCVKPSGTVSQLCDSASGIHPRFSSYYIRRVRMDTKDPLAAFLSNCGVPNEPDIHKPNDLHVFSFYCKAPVQATTADVVSAIDQLELWRVYADTFCEHKPSITVYYTDEDFIKAGSWIFDNLEKISGVAFLPKSDHVYRQAPYEAINEEEYNKYMETFPHIPWEDFIEKTDVRETVGEFACTSDKCEWVSN